MTEIGEETTAEIEMIDPHGDMKETIDPHGGVKETNMETEVEKNERIQIVIKKKEIMKEQMKFNSCNTAHTKKEKETRA